jgi:hypothetical protein
LFHKAIFDALLLASFLTGPALRAMTKGLPSSTTAGAASNAFLEAAFVFKVRENASFAVEAAVALAVETAASFVEESARGAGTEAADEVSFGGPEAAVAWESAPASVVESGLVLMS